MKKNITDTLASKIINPYIKILLVCDKRLAKLIKEKFNIRCKSNIKTHELMRGIKLQLSNLIEGKYYDLIFGISFRFIWRITAKYVPVIDTWAFAI